MAIHAVAPGSITGVFVPAGEDEASRGASFAIDDGVEVILSNAATTTVTVDGEQAPFEPVVKALDKLGVTAAVDVRPALPLGRGFGGSGAATLATVLAAAQLAETEHSREQLVQIAHAAEMDAGTGQGDVFIQSRGGLLVGTDTGVSRVQTEVPVEYESYGDIDTAAMLGDEATMAAAREYGVHHLNALSEQPSLKELTEQSWSYATDVGFPTDRVEATVAEVTAAGGHGSMPLFGDAVFAVGVEDCLVNKTHVTTTGARVID